MPGLREATQDPQFATLDRQNREFVFDRLAAEDEEFKALDAENQRFVREQLVGGPRRAPGIVSGGHTSAGSVPPRPAIERFAEAGPASRRMVEAGEHFTRAASYVPGVGPAFARAVGTPHEPEDPGRALMEAASGRLAPLGRMALDLLGGVGSVFRPATAAIGGAVETATGSPIAGDVAEMVVPLGVGKVAQVKNVPLGRAGAVLLGVPEEISPGAAYVRRPPIAREAPAVERPAPPPSEPPRPAEPAPAPPVERAAQAPPGLVPAIESDTGRIYYGEPGSTHHEIFLKNREIAGHQKRVGFAGPDGKLLSREEAEQLVVRQGLKRPSPEGELDALDYREQAMRRRGLGYEPKPSRLTTARTERGTEIQTEYRIVDADDLIASNDTALRPNPRYPQELQPRDRARAASATQIDRIARELEPSFLGESPKVGEGAPIVGPDNVVESGNARTIALQRVYGAGDARLAANAEKYRSWLEQNADRFGLDPNEIRRLDKPVLVRVRRSEVDRPRFTAEANEPAVAAFSSTEQALADAKQMPDRVLQFLEPGELTSPTNRNFVRSFLNEVVGPTELGRYVTPEGALSQEGVRRMQNAVLAKAYGDPSILEKFIESTENNVRNMATGMMNAAPRYASMKRGIAKGDLYPLDIADDLAGAVKKLSALREEGMAVEDYLAQGALFGDDISPVGRGLLRALSENSRSPKRIELFLKSYADLVEAAGNPKQSGLFSKAAPVAEDLISAAARRTLEGGDYAAESLFAPARPTPRYAGAAERGAQEVLPETPRASAGDSEAYRGGASGREPAEPLAPPPSESPAPAPAGRRQEILGKIEREREALQAQRAGRKGTVLGSGLGGAQDFAEDFPRLAAIGAYKIALGADDLAKFSKAMLDEFPELDEEQIAKLFGESRRLATASGRTAADAGGTLREDRAEVVPVPRGPQAAQAPERPGPFARDVNRGLEAIGRAAAKLSELDRHARIALENASAIEQTGTLKPGSRIPFREGGTKPETRGLRISEQDASDTMREVVTAAREWGRIHRDLGNFVDPAAQQTSKAVNALLNGAVAKMRATRFAAGRTLGTFNRPVDPEVLHALEEAGHLVEGLRAAGPRLPLYTAIGQALKNVKTLTGAEWRQLGRDTLDAVRLNLFSVTSWSLDLIGNLSEIGAQVVGGTARDLYRLAHGNLDFPSIQGFVRAVRDAKRLPEEISRPLSRRTVGGEIVPGVGPGKAGVFTQRGSAASKAVDSIVGAPLYAKGAVDTAAKHYAGAALLWREAISRATERGLHGLARRRFYNDFWRKPPAEAVASAIRAGRKAGFDRELTLLEERIAGSTMYKLLGTPFGRWPFQFTRWAGEMLGANPVVFRKLQAGTLTGEEMAEYLAKSATGWGGLWLVNHLYDGVDFRSMEYVHEDGSRTRLSGRDPIPSALWLLATIRGDEARALAALKYASLPGAGLVTGGGLLTGILKTVQDASKRADLDPRGLRREVAGMVNRAIPGQAVLSALKTAFDPVQREGVGANLPGVSELLPARVDVTTGEDLRPRQRIPGLGIEIPAVGGTPIPGAQSLRDPVFGLLSKYGLLVYRGPRQPISGVHATDIPDEWRDQWEREFGQYRQRLLGPIARNTPKELDAFLSTVREALDVAPEKLRRQMKTGLTQTRGPVAALVAGRQLSRELMRSTIQKLDSMAAALATFTLEQEHGFQEKPPRKPSIYERTGPMRFEAESPSAAAGGM